MWRIYENCMQRIVDLVNDTGVYEGVSGTPLSFAPQISKRTGNRIYLKREDKLVIHTFKLRGAYQKISNLSAEQASKGVVASSAGNHAQGVAFASSLEKNPCTIVMPKNASPAKVAATRGYGAKVILEGVNYDESSSKAKEIAKETMIAMYEEIHAKLVMETFLYS